MLDLFRTFLNETSDGDVGASSDVEAGAEATGDAGAAVAPVVEAPAPTPDWQNDPRFAEMVDQRSQAALMQLLEQYGGEPDGPPELDPYGDDFAAQLQARDEWLTQQFEARLNERLGQVQPVVDQHLESQGKEIMQEKFAEWSPQIGDFDHDAAEKASYGFLRQTNGDPEAALYEGAKYAAELRKRERAAGIEEYKASLTSDGSTLLDPPVRGSGLEGQPRYRSEEEAELAYYARQSV